MGAKFGFGALDIYEDFRKLVCFLDTRIFRGNTFPFYIHIKCEMKHFNSIYLDATFYKIEIAFIF